MRGMRALVSVRRMAPRAMVGQLLRGGALRIGSAGTAIRSFSSGEGSVMPFILADIGEGELRDPHVREHVA